MIRWILLTVVACAHVPSAQVEHYVGEIQLSIPGAKKPFAKLPAVARITKDPEAGLIMEELLHPSTRMKLPAREVVTNFTATQEFGTYNVQDDAKTFTGVVKFQGTPWHWEEWTFDFIRKDKAVIKGLATKEDGEIRSRKIVYNPKGKPAFIQEELLRSVSAAEYKKLRDKIMKKQLPVHKN